MGRSKECRCIIYCGWILFVFGYKCSSSSSLLLNSARVPLHSYSSLPQLSLKAIFRERPSHPTSTQLLCTSNGDAADLDSYSYSSNDKKDVAETEASCLPPGRPREIKRIYLISDATGVMSRSILLKALAQFDTCADEKAPYATRQPQTNQKSSDNDYEDNTSTTAGTCDVRTRYGASAMLRRQLQLQMQ